MFLNPNKVSKFDYRYFKSDDSFVSTDPQLHFIIVVSCGPPKFSNIEYRPAVKNIWAPLMYSKKMPISETQKPNDKHIGLAPKPKT